MFWQVLNQHRSQNNSQQHVAAEHDSLNLAVSHAEPDTADTADTVDTDTADTAEIWTRATRHGTEPLHLKHGFLNTTSDPNMEPNYPTRGQHVVIIVIRVAPVASLCSKGRLALPKDLPRASIHVLASAESTP